MRRIIFSILSVVLMFSTKAQDVHFSEFWATPLFSNPALTGHFEGTYRFNGIIRNQWSSVSSEPFQTFGGGMDMNAPFNLKPFGIGLFITTDNAGLSALTTTEVQGLIAARFKLGNWQNVKLHLGAKGGIIQQSIDYSKLNFGDQFNGIRLDRTLISGDRTNGGASTIALNFGAGTFLERRINERRRMGVGYSLFNLNQPDLSLSQSFESRIAMRHNLLFISSMQMLDKWDFMPSAQINLQEKQNEVVVGGAFRYHLNTGPMNPQAVRLGAWTRVGDAVNIALGLDLNNLYIGGSYDINYSTLQPASGYRGAWEASVIYIIPTVREKVKRLRQCPDYL